MARRRHSDGHGFFGRALLVVLVAAGLSTVGSSEEETSRKPFRTDADGPHDPKQKLTTKGGDPLEWFQLVDGEFPPEGSAHAVSGELMKVDHLERRFQIRVDRNDSQQRGFWDLPLDAVLLPYGSIFYHGAPAALEDIPLGTHLNGLFYLKDPEDDTPYPIGPNERETPEKDFRRCFRLEDDVSYHARQGQRWKIESVDLGTKKLAAVLQGNDGKAIGKPLEFDLLDSTVVRKGKGFADLSALEPGQLVLFNLTWVTLYGHGRITTLWIDEESRELAAAQQREKHLLHVRERGLAGWIDDVDDKRRFVTITLFGGVDPALFEELAVNEEGPVEWPFAKKDTDESAPKAALVVARESLLTYDPVNDKKRGSVFEMKKVPLEPGSSGIRVRMKVDMMLEGFRPGRIVRLYPSKWNIIALPREEQFFGRE